MYTIGQFSKVCQVTIKALRHYEKIGLITPARDELGNQYRYYTAEQVGLMKKILFFKDLGLSLKTIKHLIYNEQLNNDQLHIKSHDEAEIIIEEHRRYLLGELDRINSQLIKLGWWKNQLEAISVTKVNQYDVRLMDVQEIPVRSLRKVMTNFPQELPSMIRSLLEEIEGGGGVVAGAPIIMYYDEAFNPEKVDLEVAWPVMDSAFMNKQLPAIRAAKTVHVGPYDGLCHAYEALFKWINENGYRAVYPVREVSCNDPQVTPLEQLVTELVIPVEKI